MHIKHSSVDSFLFTAYMLLKLLEYSYLVDTIIHKYSMYYVMLPWFIIYPKDLARDVLQNPTEINMQIVFENKVILTSIKRSSITLPFPYKI